MVRKILHLFMTTGQNTSVKKLLRGQDNSSYFHIYLNKSIQLPALKTYVDYLQQVYLVKTRNELGLHANTNGRQCYIAKYRYYTSLQRTPEKVPQSALR